MHNEAFTTMKKTLTYQKVLCEENNCTLCQITNEQLIRRITGKVSSVSAVTPGQRTGGPAVHEYTQSDVLLFLPELSHKGEANRVEVRMNLS